MVTEQSELGAPVQPYVSIVTAAYNAETTLSETIESVLAQSFSEWELVIVDDGSVDSTREIAERYASKDSRIHIVAQANSGTATARNEGVRQSCALWLCMLDADDLLSPGYLERMIAFHESNPGYDIYSCDTLMLLRDGSRVPLHLTSQWRCVHSVSIVDQLWESCIAQVSLVRREVFDRCGGYRAVYSEDYDFWLRALILGARHLYNPEALWSYRRREGSKTTALVREAESLLEILSDAREMPELSEPERAECDQAIEFAHARVGRRRLEEALLRGDYRHARFAYLRYHKAFPDRPKYLGGLILMLVAPSFYARIKSKRMV